jgi:hypothetical protein
VFGIELVDDHYGIIVACRKGRKRYDFPLVDLKVTEKKSINSDIIEAYRTWFANRHFGLLIVISVSMCGMESIISILILVESTLKHSTIHLFQIDEKKILLR